MCIIHIGSAQQIRKRLKFPDIVTEALDTSSWVRGDDRAHLLPIWRKIFELSWKYLWTCHWVEDIGEHGSRRGSQKILQNYGMPCVKWERMMDRLWRETVSPDDFTFMLTPFIRRCWDGISTINRTKLKQEIDWVPKLVLYTEINKKSASCYCFEVGAVFISLMTRGRELRILYNINSNFTVYFFNLVHYISCDLPKQVL